MRVEVGKLKKDEAFRTTITNRLGTVIERKDVRHRGIGVLLEDEHGVFEERQIHERVIVERLSEAQAARRSAA